MKRKEVCNNEITLNKIIFIFFWLTNLTIIICMNSALRGSSVFQVAEQDPNPNQESIEALHQNLTPQNQNQNQINQ